MRGSHIFLSIIIPCYNESHNLRLGALAQVAYFLERKQYSWEVIVVDDGSTDDGQKIISNFIKTNPNFHLLANPHQGKAATVVSGMMSGKGKILVFSDLDQATPINQLDKLLPWFDRGYDVVIGSRNAKREGAPILRLFMARGFILLRTVVLGLSGIRDTQCGFKAFRNSAAKEIFARMLLYGKSKRVSGSLVTAGFDVEMLFLARKLDFRIKEVNVEWHYVETRRVDPWRDSLQGLVDLVRIRLNGIRGIYD